MPWIQTAESEVLSVGRVPTDDFLKNRQAYKLLRESFGSRLHSNFDSRTGETAWEFAPTGFPQEPVSFIDRSKKRHATQIEQASLASIQRSKQGKGISVDSSQEVSVSYSTPGIDGIHGHWMNPGLVTTHNRVYGQVGSSIVALSQQTGESAWHFELAPGEVARSIAGSQDCLFISLDHRLVVLNLETGKLEGDEKVARGGTLTIADGLVILAMGSPDPRVPDGGELVVFGGSAPQKPEPAKIPPPR